MASCGDDASPATDSGAITVDGSIPPVDGAAPYDGGPASRVDGGPIMCGPGGGGSFFPTFDRTCTGNGDCFVAMHTTSCCGSITALGLATSQQAAFQAAEATCDAMYPACGCASGPPDTDDGTSMLPGDSIAVECRMGQCHTFIPGQQPVACGSTSAEVFPTFDAACAADTDCVVGLHQIDCCGSQHALGLRATLQERFQSDENACRSMRPLCPCPMMPTTADDGRTAVDTSAIAVRCTTGMCRTYVP